MILKTGKEPHIEHLHIPVGTNKVSFGDPTEFATVPLPDLDRGGEIWIVRFGPRELAQPTMIFWAEPMIAKRGAVFDWAGYPELYREDRLKYELEKLGAPDDVLLEKVQSQYDPADTADRVTFWEVVV